MDMKELVLSILSKNKTLEEATEGFTQEEINHVQDLVKSVKDRLSKMGMPGTMPPGGMTFKEEDLSKPAGVGYSAQAPGGYSLKAEMIKFDKNGQWTLDKAEPPTLDYSKMKPDPKASEDNAPTLDYSKMKAASPTPKPWAGAKAKSDAALKRAGMEPLKPKSKI